MKVGLLHVPRFYWGFDKTWINAFPQGLFGLADAVRRAGHCVEVDHLGRHHDASYPDMGHVVDSFLVDRDYDLLGVTLHWHPAVPTVLEFVRELKRRVSWPIVLGGFTASFFAQEILEESPEIDFVIRGDGEVPLAQLASALDAQTSLGSIGNLLYRAEEGRVVSNSSLPFVAGDTDLARYEYASLDLLRPGTFFQGEMNGPYKAGQHNGPFWMVVGRGCPLSCTICSGSTSNQGATFHRKVEALRSTDAIMASMYRLADFGLDRIAFCFDPPSARETYSRLFSAVAHSSLRQHFGAIFEAYEPPDEDFVDAFVDAFEPTRSQLALSPDYADERLRRRHKGYSYSNTALVDGVRRIRRRGVDALVYFALSPLEDVGIRQLREKRELMVSVWRNGARSTLHPVQMEPGAPWHRHPEKFGVELTHRTFREFWALHRGATVPGEAPPLGYVYPNYATLVGLSRPTRTTSRLGAAIRTLLGGVGPGCNLVLLHERVPKSAIEILESSKPPRVALWSEHVAALVEQLKERSVRPGILFISDFDAGFSVEGMECSGGHLEQMDPWRQIWPDTGKTMRICGHLARVKPVFQHVCQSRHTFCLGRKGRYLCFSRDQVMVCPWTDVMVGPDTLGLLEIEEAIGKTFAEAEARRECESCPAASVCSRCLSFVPPDCPPLRFGAMWPFVGAVVDTLTRGRRGPDGSLRLGPVQVWGHGLTTQMQVGWATDGEDLVYRIR